MSGVEIYRVVKSLVRNLNRIFNKKRPIEKTVEVSIFYKKYKKRMEIDIIDG